MCTEAKQCLNYSRSVCMLHGITKHDIIYIYIYIYIKIIQGDIFFKIGDILNLTNFERTDTNKKCKKVYTNGIITR